MKTKPWFCLSLSLILLASIFSEKVISANELLPADRIEPCAPSLVAAIMDESAVDFNTPESEMVVKNGNATIIDHLDNAPFFPFEGAGCLMANTDIDGNLRLASPTVFPESDILSGFAVTVYPLQGGVDNYLSLSLSIGSSHYQGSIDLLPDRWQTVFFDLSAVQVNGCDCSYTLSFSARERQYYLIDLCGLTSASTPLNQLNYSAREYCDNAGRVMDFPLNITLSDSNTAIFTDSPVPSKIERGTGLCVQLINDSSARTFDVIVKYLTGTEARYEGRLGNEGESTTVTVPLASGEIERLSFSFPQGDGTVKIMSVKPVPFYEKSESVGYCSDCLINRSCDLITVRGNFTEEEAKTYRGQTLNLYCFSPGEDETALTERRRPVATASVTGDTFSFQLPLSADYRELFQRFAVYLEYPDGIIAVGSSRSVSNPEILAGNSPTIALNGIKGLSNIDLWQPTDGVCCTDEVVYADRLLTTDPDKGQIVSFGGGVCQIDRDALSALDKTMLRYQQRGLQVHMRIFPDSGTGVNHPLAFNSQYPSTSGFSLNEDKLLSLGILCHFLAERYGTEQGISENVVSFVVGNRVNEAKYRYAVNAHSLSEQVKAYEAAFRAVYQGVRSVSSEISVFLPIGGVWYHAQTSGETSVYDSSLFLHCFSAYTKEKGEMNFGIAYDPYSGQKVGYSEDSPDLSEKALYVNFSNLEVLCQDLNRSELRYQGKTRTILLLQSDEIPAITDEEALKEAATEYIYDYLRLRDPSFSTVCGFIPDHPVDYRGSFGAVDTNRFDEFCRFAADRIGNEQLEELYHRAFFSASDVRQLIKTEFTDSIPTNIIGKADLFTFSEKGTMFQPGIGCQSLKTDVSVGGVDGLAVFCIDAADPCPYRGITVSIPGKLDLTGAPYLALTVQPAVLPDGIETVGVAIEIGTDQHRYFATGKATEGSFTTLYADLREYPYIDNCRQISLYIFGLDGADIGEANLMVERISILSSKWFDNELSAIIEAGLSGDSAPKEPISIIAVVLPAAIGGIALFAEIYRIIRRKKTDADSHQDNR